MRRTWPFILAVAAAGGLVGTAIAGRPHPADPFVLNPNTAATTTTSQNGAAAIVVRSTTTSTVAELDRTKIRVVLANASGRARTGQSIGDLLASRGSSQVRPTDAAVQVSSMAVCRRTECGLQAKQVASNLGNADVPTAPLPEDHLTLLAISGDLLVVERSTAA
jgi:hypothetical protein